MDTLTAKIAALNEQKAAREERIAAVGAEIMALWKRLATPEDEQAAFLEEHAGLGDAVIAAVRGGRVTWGTGRHGRRTLLALVLLAACQRSALI